MAQQHRLRTGTQSIDDASNELARSLNDWFIRYGPSIIFKTCENCSFMSEAPASAFCDKFKMTPPASVICSGCPEHHDKEEVPF